MTKLRHKATNKIYDWSSHIIKRYRLFMGHPSHKHEYVAVRTNAEVYPEEFYDFSRSQRDGSTQYYIEEPLADFEIIN